MSLNNLAGLLQDMGEHRAARPLFERALAIREKALGPEHPYTASSLNNLALLLSEMGDHRAARPLHERALAIREKALGPEHPYTAQSLNNLALLLSAMGEYRAARPLHERALAIREKALGPEHPYAAISLGNLASLLDAMGDHRAARPLYERALAIHEKALGPEHPHTTTSIHNLATLLSAMGEHRAARPLFERALAINEKAPGPEHPDTAANLNGLALLLFEMGDHHAARPFFERALAIREKALGPEHPDTVISINNLATLLEALGEHRAARPLYERALEGEERRQASLLLAGTEGQKQAFLDTLVHSTHNAVSFHYRDPAPDRSVVTMALQTVLRRKARALEAMADQLATLRKHLAPADRGLLDELADVRRRYAALVLSPTEGLPAERLREHRARIDDLAAEATRLETLLSRKNEAFAVETTPITIESIQKALPPKTALVELLVYRPFDPRAAQDARWGAPRYAAYVLPAQGHPQGLDLGDADTIDEAARALRRAIASLDPKVEMHAKALDALVMARLRPLLGDAEALIISPDGELAQVPFETLMDPEGRWLVGRYRISYVASGRDLMRLRVKTTPRSAPVMLADVDFDASGTAPSPTAERVAEASTTSPATRSADRAMASLSWNRLPGTAKEADALGALPLFSGSRVLRRDQATEAAVRKVQAPRILHLATHGFFLEDQPNPAPVGPGETPRPVVGRESPLVRSGLVLAGANRRESVTDGDDGVLTALEVSGLDLYGTELVVMSACETGVGESRRGQGVFGLQRALVLAGVRTQVMSLWKVDDHATQALMVAYYQRLSKGEGRAEAMRQVRLALLDGKMAANDLATGTRTARAAGEPYFPDWTHPYYWASFIVSGDTAPLSKVTHR